LRSDDTNNPASIMRLIIMIFLEADTNEYHLNKLKTCSYVGYNKLKIRSSCADSRLDFSNQLKFP